ncbi:MAG: hypothetical protein JSU86_19130 [Phycisphaerales bacterium]|nr:MAG: hypothetical protein JSU86_19130 [Phycisphaerales bacterium]
MCLDSSTLVSLVIVAGLGVANAHAQAGRESANTGQSDGVRYVTAGAFLSLASGDYDSNGRVDLDDFAYWPACMTGPHGGPYAGGCEVFDFDGDSDVDLLDQASFQAAFFGLLNDDCTSPTSVVDGLTRFSTTGATTDGPDEPAACDFYQYTHIESDIWYCYTATCSGEAVVSLCGSDYDTKMAVYPGCGCPAAAPIACSDDDCGVGFESRITLQAQAGQSYLIRIGGFEGEQGSGILNILCDVETCAPGSGDCFAPHPGRGCDDVECCQTTCEVDPFCCDAEWDDFCAGEAAGLCTGSFPACAPGAGSCGSANDTPGCDDIECCNVVCMVDPFCCVDIWDELCADEAFGMCFLACGGESGSCFSANSTPGCSDVECCEAVCDQDEFCCWVQWDGDCADSAGTVCR